MNYVGITIDFVMTKAMDDASFGIERGQKRLADLDFADDISAISHSLAGIQDKLRENQGHEYPVSGRSWGLETLGPAILWSPLQECDPTFSSWGSGAL